MITAVDSNVLLDVFGADPTFGPASREALRRCRTEGALIACDVVWAEVAAAIPSPGGAGAAMERLGVASSALDAGRRPSPAIAWRSYRRGGGERLRVIADFLVGAHAERQAERLLTRDRGFYRSYFAELRILDPTRP